MLSPKNTTAHSLRDPAQGNWASLTFKSKKHTLLTTERLNHWKNGFTDNVWKT